MIKHFQFLVFLIIQILFVPLGIIGVIVAGYKEMLVSKKLGVSYTAGQALKIRWMMNYFRLRTDEESVKFVKVLPIESHFGLMVVIGPTIIAQRICGFKPSYATISEPDKETFSSFTNSRTIYFDRSMEKNVEQQTRW